MTNFATTLQIRNNKPHELDLVGFVYSLSFIFFAFIIPVVITIAMQARYAITAASPALPACLYAS